MSDGGIRVSLAGDPPRVSLARRADVSDALWLAVVQIYEVFDSSTIEFDIALPRFLARRNRFGTAVRSYGGRLELSEELRRALKESDVERSHLHAVIGGDAVSHSSATAVSELKATRFKRELMTFQERDLTKILSLPHGANFSVPGAGKTTVCYATYELERARGRVDRMLVVAPLSAFEAWHEEARECMEPAPVVSALNGAIRSNVEVLLVNYQRLDSRMEQIEEWMRAGRCHLVLDEAHRMKRGRSGEWGAACLELSHGAVRRDILTGTPAPNHPSDLRALLEFLWPYDVSRILPTNVSSKDPDSETMETIARRIKPLFARTNKSELELDEPTLLVEEVEMKPLQQEIYKAIEMRAMRAGMSASDRLRIQHLGEVTMYMIQAASNPALLANAVSEGEFVDPDLMWPETPIPLDATVVDKVIRYAEHEIPAKFEKLASLVRQNTAHGRKTLVWTNFVGNLLVLHEKLLAPFEPAIVYGAIPVTAGGADEVSRESEIARFRNDDSCSVLLANPAAMSEGVSLHHECHDAVYVDRTFNAGHYLQSIDRIHRLGLKPGTETTITFLVCKLTIDEAIDSRIRVKAKRLAEVLSDDQLQAMSLPDEESGYGEWIDDEDAEAVLQHLRNAS